jgi:hypothetical protein
MNAAGTFAADMPKGRRLVVAKRPKRKTRRISPERRIDVTRLEYLGLLEMARRNQESIRRLEQMAATQFQRTVEQQAEIDALKRVVVGK